MKDLKQRALRGGFAKMCAQVANYTLRIGSLMVMARLLNPRDFGLVGMVTAFTGVLSLFRDFGLSAATVQRVDVTEHQMSTLFWVNILVGALLSTLAAAIAPFAVSFYHEPHLFWVTIAVGTTFLLNAAGVQHSALLQRQMRFTALATIDVLGWLGYTMVGITLALKGFGYWALVGATIAAPIVVTLCMWLTTRWIPGRPRRGIGLHSMMRFGGGLTLTGLIVYVAYNFEKVLLGRFWGADAVGLYGRAYQLSTMPTDNLNAAVGEVAFSALSRVRNDPPRFKSYFLKAYSLVLALTIPITIAVALFSPELIAVVLGPKWSEAAPIFRLLSPTILIFAMINPIGWMIFSLGMIGRSLKVAMVLAPLVITGYILGLPYGPKGVALAYSTVMVLWVVPHVAWGLHGTIVSLRDIALVVSKPLVSGVVAAAFAFLIRLILPQFMTRLPQLLFESVILMAVYLGMLLFVMGQKHFYLDLLRGFRKPAPVEEPVLAST
ncbi:MAG TPA: lipopolysaccharide biosynthesis protein [Candidatus Solibacter sp.]|nr:lipopolysaccharide biosynthesis protein [Candidatus Solibacter sp.]